MDTTSLTLLQKLQSVAPDSVAWKDAYDRYRPFVAFWIVKFGGPAQEVPQLVNDCMSKLFEFIQRFDRQRLGSFRTFLREVAHNRVRDYWNEKRRHAHSGWGDELEQKLNEHADPHSELSRQSDLELKALVLAELFARVKSDFDEKTWVMFLRTARDGEKAVDVAKELGLAQSTVREAKRRVFERLREEAGAMFEEEEVDDIFA
jgi:RNA polymerase sigma-70 factor (ECF subfamily)